MLALLTVGTWALAHAQEREPDPVAIDPFVAVRDADPLELARVVARHGDQAVLDRLGRADTAPALVTLSAVRASPWLGTPEAALTPLAMIALGSDPDLAPAAVQAIVAIVEAADASELVAHETTLADLTPATSALESLAADDSARADLRAAAELCIARLGTFVD